MAGLKEIKRRLASVQNTKKITYAMKLVSAAKLKKAQDAVTRSREYTDALNSLLADLLAEDLDEGFSHPLLEAKSQTKSIRVLIIGGARGLCGGYNTNINKRADAFVAEKRGFNLSFTILGRKPADHFRRVRREFLSAEENLPEDAALWPVEEVCAQLEQEFADGVFDELYIIYTKFKSALSQSVICERVLPMDRASTFQAASGKQDSRTSGSTLFEPSPKEVFDAILPRIFRSIVRQAALEAKASEQGSRMTAMDAATRNAGELIKKLTRLHNRVRQSGITAQLLDIVGGANAVE